MDPHGQKRVGRGDKIALPHAGHAHAEQVGGKANVKPNWPAAKALTLTAVEQIDAGHYTLDAIGQVDKANGSLADERSLMQALRGMKGNQQLLWFVRGEADTTKVGAPADQAHPVMIASAV